MVEQLEPLFAQIIACGDEDSISYIGKYQTLALAALQEGDARVFPLLGSHLSRSRPLNDEVLWSVLGHVISSQYPEKYEVRV